MADQDEPFKLLKVPEVAELLRCSESNVYNLVAGFRLKCCRVGGSGNAGLRFTMEQIEQFLNESAEAKQESASGGSTGH